MKKLTFTADITVYPDIESLPDAMADLMRGAITAREKAYAPYSKFRVGAALLLEDGSVVYGNNQENAAFPSGLCAERVAVFHAGATHPGKTINALAITAASELRAVTEAIAPCGGCRQALAEYEYRQNSPIAVYFMGDRSEVYLAASVKELLPLVFTKDDLLNK